MRPYIRATCNPDPDSFVRRLIDWWIGDDGYPIPERSGVIRWFLREKEQLHWADTREELLDRFGPKAKRKSFTFIRAKLSDNPALTQADPDYEGNLEAMGHVDRERLLGGNWDIKPAAGNYFRRSWFRVIEPEDVPWDEVRRTVRAWDKAATKPSTHTPDPDWTRGAKVSRLEDGGWIVHHVEGLRDTPGRVEDAMKRIAAQDGIGTTVCGWQDPGAAGVADAEAVLKALTGYRVELVKAAKDKLTYAGLWSPHVERGRVMVVRGPWNEAFFAEAESFPNGGHDDQADAVSLAFLVLAEIPQYGYMPVRVSTDRSSNESERPVKVTQGFRARGGVL